MPLADLKAPAIHPGIPCSVAELIASLPDAETQALQRMLADPRWTHEAIYAACVAEGYRVARQTVGRHRKGLCRCGTGA